MLKPKARLCPARRPRANISKASGNWAAKSFSRWRRRYSNQPAGSIPMAMPARGTIAAGLFRKIDSVTPAAARTAEITASLRGRQRRIGLREHPLEIETAEAFHQRVQYARSLVQGPRQHAGLLQEAVLGGRRRVGAGEQVEAVFQAGAGLLVQQHRQRCDQGGHAHEHGSGNQEARSLNPPSSPAGGKRWKAAARPPSPAAA